MENKQKGMEINKKPCEIIGEIIGNIIGEILIWFIPALFIMWGWNVLAPYLGCPLFTYWEVFAMRLGLIQIMKILFFWVKK